ncbi:MAG: amidohydrolase [Proteobacteria bacterium]|nr:amidohydrolase [Pseudomonadota bacterium]
MALVTALWAAAFGCGDRTDVPSIGDGKIPFDEDADPPVCQDEEITQVVDVHEHIMGAEGLDVLLAVLGEVGIDRTVAFAMLDTRYEDSLLLIEEATSNGMLIPFTTVDVRDPAALLFLEESLDAGAVGLKLFSGHGEYHGDTPLDSPLAEPIYDYLEATGTPLLMHVNGGLYLDELERVLDAHPDLVMICPHLCLLSKDPGRLAQLLDTHPNLSVDLSFGNPMAELQGFTTLSENIDLWRRFVRVYVDRVNLGSDTVFMGEAVNANSLSDVRSYLDFVRHERFFYEGEEYNGLGADACTQKHILQHNPERFVAGLPPQRAP